MALGKFLWFIVGSFMTYIYNHDPLLPIDSTSKLMAFKVRILVVFVCVEGEAKRLKTPASIML